ncbi:MAG TPA: TonB-dependent receptor [Cyclobacteriaceae bacterium]|nr:TonB-dependent receptor [Cyclobacteriaceae bacterium]
MHCIYVTQTKRVFTRPITLSLVIILLLNCSSGFLHAFSLKDQHLQIELSLHETTLKKALKEIERQTDYHFVMNDNRLKDVKKISIEIKSEKIEEVLDQLLQGTNVTYKIRKKQITIIPLSYEVQLSPDMLTSSASARIGLSMNPVLFSRESSPDIKVTGKVKDDAGQPLPGVNIVVKGTTIGTTTDANGEYSINVSSSESVLIFSFIGYVTEEITVNSQTVIDMILTQDIQSLSEIVVVGYGTQEKKDVTGSIASVKGSDFENLPSGGAQQSLQGRMSGVNIVRNGGEPGNSGTILIRGMGTVNNAEPLIVVDGVALPPGSSMNDVNQNDIQSVEVLKDASASAIYGTRAANGVILLTTKRGKLDDKLNLSVNAYTGVSNRIKTLDVLDAPTYTKLKQESFTNDGAAIPAIWQDPQYQTQKTNWQDKVLKQGTTNNIDLSIRGGGKYSSFAISGGKYDEKGIIGKSYYKRYTLRINTDHKIGERIKIGQSLQITNVSNVAPNTTSAQDGLLWSAIRFHPGLPVKNAYGNYTSSIPGFGDINNPLYTIATQDKSNTRSLILGNVTGEYEILKGLKAKANVGIDANFSDSQEFNVKIDSQYRQTNYNQLSITNDKNWSFLQEYFLSYDKKVGDHSIGVVAGYTSQTFNDVHSKEVGRDFPSEDPSLRYMGQAGTILNLGADPDPTKGSGGKSYDALQSVFGRANYSFKEKYLLTATYRADGSSKFRNGLQWGYFPAFSVGWRISEEPFFKNALPFISNMKLTGGTGHLGNQNVGRLQYLALLRQGGTYNNYAFGNDPQNQVQGTAQSTIPNPNIGWETAEMTNFGIDAGLLENRILFSAAYFIKDTKNMLLAPPSLGTLGKASIPDQNVGQIRNKGLEIEASYRKTAGDFIFTISGNATFIKNRITKLQTPGSFLGTPYYGRPNQEITRSYVGHPYGTFYGWVADGLYQNQNQIDTDPNIANDSRRADIHPGDVRFKDLTGDGIIDAKDRTILGSPQPKVTYGLNATLAYKSFDLSLFFIGVGGVDIYNADRMQGLDASYPFNMYAEVKGRWTDEGTSNSIPRLSSTDPNTNFRTSTLFIESGAFLRFKNFNLGYTIPQKVSNVAHINKARIYITGQNIFTVTKYKGLNPELGFPGNGQINVDYAQYPQSKTYTIGATLSF